MRTKKQLPFFQRSFAMFSFVMVVATITLAGLVGFRFLDAQDNTEVAVQTAPQEVTTVASTKDVEAVAQQLDTTELDAIDAELDSQFDF